MEGAIRQPKVCILSIVDGAGPGMKPRVVHPSITWLVVTRRANGTSQILLRDLEGQTAVGDRIAVDECSNALREQLHRIQPEYVVVSVAGDYWPEDQALMLAARAAESYSSWAVQVDVAMQTRKGFIYPYGDFLAYRSPQLSSDFRLPLSLANLLVTLPAALEHLEDFVRLPGSTHWQRLLAMRLILQRGAPQRLPIVTGWRRLQIGLGAVDERLHPIPRLVELAADTQCAAMTAVDLPAEVKLLIALQAHICRFATSAVVAEPENIYSEDAEGRLPALLAEILRSPGRPLALAAEIVDQIGLCNLDGLEVEPTEVSRQVAQRLRYAHDMHVFHGLGIDLRPLAAALGGHVPDPEAPTPVTPTILMLVSALCLGKTPRPDDLVLGNLATLGRQMDANFNEALELSERRQEKQGGSLLALQGLPRELAIRMIGKLGLTGTALRIRAGVKKFRLVS